ncbi:response regulator [bacterium]|nr:response regulator [bacterium]
MANPVTAEPLEILLVEDSPTDALLMQEALASSTLFGNFHHVENGEDAMAFLRHHDRFADAPRPGLVLLDLNLPRKSGLEVLHDIKEDDDLKTIPVVVLTTSRDEADVKGSYGMHANCYVCKPVEFRKLDEVVQGIEHFWLNVATLPPREHT